MKGNPQLRSARVHKGWSQEQVAAFVGTNRFTVARWERGSAFPSPYFRQKLAELFGTSLEALGLVPIASPLSNRDAEQESDLDITASSSLLSEVSLLPPLPHTHAFVGREDTLQYMKQQMCHLRPCPVFALHGLPGAGKTALAIELASDPDVKAMFPDGICWIGLGPTPDIAVLLRTWIAKFAPPATEMKHLQTVDELSRALHIMIGSKRMLLILDDAWQLTDALACKVGGPACTHLLTTRFPLIATQFAHDHVQHIQELDEQQGLTLLTHLAPEVVAHHREQAQTVVRAVGGLPLALVLMGRSLYQESVSRQEHRVRALLTQLHKAEERLRLAEPCAPGERPLYLTPDTPVSLQSAITISIQRLPHETQKLLPLLAVFPAKPQNFSEEAALAVCGLQKEQLREHLDRLIDAGLLTPVASGWYSFHQTIVDYILLNNVIDEEIWTRMICYFATYAQQHQSNYALLDREIALVLIALQMAYERNMTDLLAQGVVGVATYLSDRGMLSTAELHLTHACESLKACGTVAKYPEVLEQLGWVVLALGKYDRAEVCVKEGLALITNPNLAHYSCAFIHLHGVLLLKEGKIVQAEELCQQAYRLAQARDDRVRLLSLLGNLTKMATVKGNWKQAESLSQEGLAMAHALEQKKHICNFLLHSGTIAGMQGNYAQAQESFQRGLEIARTESLCESACYCLTNLAVVAMEQGKYQQAEAYLQEAREQAQRIGHGERLCGILANLGGLCMNQMRDAEAEAHLWEGLLLARSIGHAERLSALLCRLGLVMIRQERYAEAAEYIQESICVAESMNHRYRLGEARLAWGELKLKEGLVLEAENAFQAALTCTQETHIQVMVAEALFGLARTALLARDARTASERGHQSLELFESLGHHGGEEVRKWFAQHAL